MAKVIVFRGRRKEATYDLDRRELVIGRSEEADIRVENPLVSRTHAVLRFEDSAWQVADLESPNGLYVNGERVTARKLRPGDRIELGQHFVVFAPTGDDSWDVDTVADHRRSGLAEDEPTAILPPGDIESIHRKVQRRMEAHIVLQEGRQRREIQLQKTKLVVGFSDECDIVLSGRSMFSKKVAELVFSHGAWSVVALTSLVPVRVGDEKVSTRALRDGDVLTVKDSELTFHKSMRRK